MQKLTQLTDIRNITEESIITITMTLHQNTITDDKDSIQLKNLLDEAANSVKDSVKFGRDDSIALKEQAIQTKDYIDELVNNDDGLVLYITPENVYYYHVNIELVDKVTFSNRPNILPSVENKQYSRNFHVLLLNRDSIRLFEKNGYSLTEINLEERSDDAPVNQDIALGTELDGGELNFGSGGPTGNGSGQVFHGHNEVSQEKDVDRKRYFNIVDDYIKKEFTNPTNYPLLLFALPENQSVFREHSQNEYLLEENISESGADSHDDQINEKVEEKVADIIQKEHDELLERFRETTPEYTINDILDDLSMSALESQIEEIIIEKGYEPNGYIDENGRYQEDSERKDYIYQLTEQLVDTDASIYLLDEDEMPGDTRISARLRYVKE